MANADVFLIRLYQDQITQAGFEFLMAHNGMEATRIIENEHPDIILLDLILPQKSGFEILEDLQKNEGTKDIPVCIISILSQESDKQEALQLGAKAYFIKSEVRVSDVMEKIHEWAKQIKK